VTDDAIVIGAGPNGLAAAIAMAHAGRAVRVYEAESTIGGSTRSLPLTEPGYLHDVCATVHALVRSSPFLKSLPLGDHGLELVQPDAPLAHPFDDGSALVIHQSIAQTMSNLSRRDAMTYRALLTPFVERADALMEALLAPLNLRHPLLMAKFGRYAIQSARGFARRSFADERTRAMFAGVAAHSMVPLQSFATAGYGLALLTSAHAVGWPIARGGSQRLSNALSAYLQSLGGEIVLNTRIERLEDLPSSPTVLCDVTPRQFLRIAGDRLPSRYRARLAKYRYGPGVFKMDWALNAPVPWRAAECRLAGTLHLGGTMDEIARSESDAWDGRHSEQPYVLAVQASLFDDSRAPSGKHTLWAYCHVPNGSTVDMRERIENQIERFAPGFRDCIVARSAMFPADLERKNANLVGGDIAGGAADLAQLFTRPIASLDPYRTPLAGVYLCSSSTPPGIGVHGMCGYYAARSALAAKR
jgi:phytoene dehydrogenase-like protein